jgi:hypothetical protein
VADPKLLDDSLLEGQHAVIRQIGPELVAILVDANDLSDCVSAVVGSSELWGSSCFVFVPVDRGLGTPDVPWIEVTSSGRFDGFSPRSVIEADIGTRLAGLGQGPGGFSETVWSVLAAQPELRDSFPLVLQLPKQEDPWYVAYLGAFGAFHPGPAPMPCSAPGFVLRSRLTTLLRSSAEKSRHRAETICLLACVSRHAGIPGGSPYTA